MPMHAHSDIPSQGVLVPALRVPLGGARMVAAHVCLRLQLLHLPPCMRASPGQPAGLLRTGWARRPRVG
jgi:hypothetical protein